MDNTSGITRSNGNSHLPLPIPLPLPRPIPIPRRPSRVSNTRAAELAQIELAKAAAAPVAPPTLEQQIDACKTVDNLMALYKKEFQEITPQQCVLILFKFSRFFEEKNEDKFSLVRIYHREIKDLLSYVCENVFMLSKDDRIKMMHPLRILRNTFTKETFYSQFFHFDIYWMESRNALINLYAEKADQMDLVGHLSVLERIVYFVKNPGETNSVKVLMSLKTTIKSVYQHITSQLSELNSVAFKVALEQSLFLQQKWDRNSFSAAVEEIQKRINTTTDPKEIILFAKFLAYHSFSDRSIFSLMSKKILSMPSRTTGSDYGKFSKILYDLNIRDDEFFKTSLDILKSHPGLFRVEDTLSLLLVNNRYVYYPPPPYTDFNTDYFKWNQALNAIKKSFRDSFRVFSKKDLPRIKEAFNDDYFFVGFSESVLAYTSQKVPKEKLKSFLLENIQNENKAALKRAAKDYLIEFNDQIQESFKTGKEISKEEFLENLYIFLIYEVKMDKSAFNDYVKKHLKDFTNKELLIVAKYYRKVKYKNFSFFHHIIPHLLASPNPLSTKDIITLAQSLALSSIYDERVFKLLKGVITDTKIELDHKSTVQCVSSIGAVCINDPFLLNCLVNRIKDSSEPLSYVNVLLLASALCVAGYKDAEFIISLIKIAYAHYDKFSQKHKDMCTKIFSYLKCTLNVSVSDNIERIQNMFYEEIKNLKKLSSKQHEQVSALLTELKIPHKNEHFACGYFLDIVVSKDTYIEVCGDTHNVTDLQTQKKWDCGTDVMRQGILAKNGWKYIKVSTPELKDIPKLTARLSKELAQFVVQ
jgi:hypothetical protein